MEFLANLIEEIKKPTLLCEFVPEDENLMDIVNVDSHIGGKPYIKKDEPYPACNCCERDMQFIFQIREIRKNTVLLHVFYYCNSCKKTYGKDGFEMKTYINPSIEDANKQVNNPYPILYASFFAHKVLVAASSICS